MHISQQSFGILENGEEVFQINMENTNGVQIEIISYGAIIKSIKTTDLEGSYEDIVLGKDDLKGYVEDDSCLGAVVGPVAGRIGKARAMISGYGYQFDANDGENLLHGGSAALHKKNWKPEISETENSVKVELTYKAKDLEGGYPGNRSFKTTYILNNKNQLMVYFDATTDRDTIINLSTHSYFNLSGKHQNIYDHKMMMNSLKVLNMDKGNIPDGTEKYILGTPYNFSRGALIGEALSKIDFGIDHAYILNKEYGAFGISAKVVHEPSGRTMDLVTDQPVVVFYTANHYDGSKAGNNGHPLSRHHSFCLEPQHHPDAPNHSEFPTIEVKAGEKYKSRTQLSFGLTSDSHHH
jgi:aldose 1-epimerase